MALFPRQAPNIPALTPEYLDFNTSPHLLSVSGGLTALALLVFLLRAYVRTVMLRVFGVDDALMLVAIILAVTVFALFVQGTHYGIGKHIFAISPQQFSSVFYLLFWQGLLVVSAVSFVKLSIAFFLLRLAQRTQYRRFLYGVVVFLILFTFVSCGPIIFQYRPVAAAWNFSLRPPPLGTGTGKCMDINVFGKIGVFNSSINAFTDVLFAALPIPMIWTLKINFRTKTSLIGILSLGFLACFAAIYKTPLQYHFFEDTDPTGHGAWFWVWQIIELTLGIISASLPSLKPLFNWFLETAKAFTTNSRSRTGTQNSGFKRNSSLNYFKSDTFKSKNDGAFELASVTASERTENGGTGRGRDMYSVKVTGEGWDAEKGRYESDEAILPIQGGDGNEIMVTKSVVVL